MYCAASLVLVALLATTARAVEVRPGPKAAAGVRDTLFVVPSIVVEADRPRMGDEPLTRSGFVARVELDERRARVADLSTVLSGLVGVRVTQYGGLGSFATASIRGSSSGQVKVFLDGVPLDDAYLGVTDLSELPLGGVRRVDVYRGFTPPALGASVIGGAINLVTWDGDALERGRVVRAEAHESYGSFDTARHQLSVWSHPPHLKLFVHGGYTRSLGDFRFLDDNGTPLAPDDDAVVARTNNDFDVWSALLRAEADVPGFGSVAAGHDASRHERGVPGLGAFQSKDARSRRDWNMTHLRIAPTTLLPRRLAVSAVAFHSRSEDEFSDPDGTISLVATETRNAIRSYGGRVRARWLLPRVPLALEGVYEGRRDVFHPSETFPAERRGPERWRRSDTGALGAEVHLFRQRLVVTATERFERQTNEFFDEGGALGLPPTPRGRFAEHNRSPSVGVRWQATPFLTVKGNAGRYYRLPTFLELFGNVGSVTGNASLVPEEGLNRDAGVVVAIDRAGPIRAALFEVVYLDNEVDNLILFFPNSQRTSRPVNIGSARIRGVELSAAAGLGRQLRVAANYTHLDAKDTSDIPYYAGNQLPSRPRHEAGASATYARGVWRLTYELRLIGANFLDRANRQEASRRDLHNVVVGLETPVPGVTLSFEARNLADDHVTDVAGYPLPGRSFYMTLSYRYSPAKE